MGLALTLATGGCASVQGILGSDEPSWADQVVVRRDAWGVPIIEAENDAAAAFGLAYAQAEDNFWQLEENVIRAIGRAANLYGETELAGDLVQAAFEVPRLAREEYEREPVERRALWDAWAAGLNHYLAMHPDVRPRLIWRFEPWHALALARPRVLGRVVDGVRIGDVAGFSDPLPGGARTIATFDSVLRPVASGSAAEGAGSSLAWAIAPPHTAGGRALLYHAVQDSLFGARQPYEARIRSAQGYEVSGATTFGSPVLQAGHSLRHAWGHAPDGVDTGDAWLLRFDHPTDSLAYRWNGEWRQAVPVSVAIAVNTRTGLEQRQYTFLRSHAGPVVARMADDVYVAVRIARMEAGGALQQWYEMGRATSLDAFREALAQNALVGRSTVYADTAGNILAHYGGAVPRRVQGIDPTRPIDGGYAATDWDGYHAASDVPQLVNPASGMVYAGRGAPVSLMADAMIDRTEFPSYMIGAVDTTGTGHVEQMLAADTAWTLDALERAAFDVRMPVADVWIPRLIDEYERRGAVDPAGVLALDDAVESLRAWDGAATATSSEATLFLLWLERVRRPFGGEGSWPLTSALEWTVDRLQRQWESTDVPWGDVQRLQRIHTSGNAPFDDEAPSMAIGGAPPWAGGIFAVAARPVESGRRYAVVGTSWIQVVELGPVVSARSVSAFGQSADPASPHHLDQAQLFVEGRLKSVGDSVAVPGQ